MHFFSKEWVFLYNKKLSYVTPANHPSALKNQEALMIKREGEDKEEEEEEPAKQNRVGFTNYLHGYLKALSEYRPP